MNEHLKSEKWMRGRMSHKLYRVVPDAVHGFALENSKSCCFVLGMDTDPAIPKDGEWWERSTAGCPHWPDGPKAAAIWPPDTTDVLALYGRSVDDLRERVRCGCLAPVNFGLGEALQAVKALGSVYVKPGESSVKLLPPYSKAAPAERCKYAQFVDAGVELVYTDSRGLDADMRGLRSGSPEMIKVETLMGQQIIDDTNKAKATVKRRLREWPLCPYGGTVNLMRMKTSRLGFKCNKCSKKTAE